MSSFSEENSERFNEAAKRGDLSLVEALSLDLTVDLNWKNEGFRNSAFCWACDYNRLEIVRFLLDFTGTNGCRNIDCNLQNFFGWSPFFMACASGHDKVVELLLKDDRIDVNQGSNSEESPLFIASHRGHVGVLKLILASGREFDMKKRGGEGRKTAAEIASKPSQDWESKEEFVERKKRCLAIASLLALFERDPRKVRVELQKEHDESHSGELFALMVFLSDGYLKIQQLEDPKNTTEKRSKAKRFLSLASQLPLDLQMVLCNRVFGLEGIFVKRSLSEKGFRWFAKGF